MSNSVLKDKDNNILNPKIPRYEKKIQEHSNYIVIGNLKICWGTAVCNYTNANIMLATSNFPITYEERPVAMATIRGTNNGISDLDRNVKIQTLTNTGIGVSLQSNSGKFQTGYSQDVDWIAIGY